MCLDRKLTSKQIIKRIVVNHVGPYKNQVLLAIFFMVVVAICSAVIVGLVKPAIDDVFLSHDRHMLVILPLVMFSIYALKGVAEYLQCYLIKYVGQQVLTHMQMLMYKHLLFADFLFLQSQSSGKLISRFTNDIVLMRGAISNMLVGCAKHFLSVLFLIILMFSLDPYLSIFVFLVFPIAIIPVQRLGRKMRNIIGEAQEELSNFTAQLDETFDSIKIIKSFCTEEIEIKKAQGTIFKILKFYKKATKFESLTSPIMEVLSGLAIACVLWYGGYVVIKGDMTTGSLFSFITAFVSAYRPFKSLVSLNINLQEGLAAANRIFNILDLKPKIYDLGNNVDQVITNPQIEFHNISVRFGQKIAIKLLDLKLLAGKTYAFVGRSGGGKTTIANLMIRLFDPTDGQILIDNIDVKKMSLKNLRHNIAMVTQDVVLFDVSVADNIAYGVEGVLREDIVRAAKAADAHDFITALPQGYNTMVGSAASTLSGGQRQRLSIARAFLKDAPILLLDEATSALDSNSEQSIINSIIRLRRNRVTLIITHRLGSITHADRIIVMKNGKVFEQGTHAELLKTKQEYFKLYNRELKEAVNAV